MFIKTVFKTTFGLSDVLKITFSALNHVNNIRSFPKISSRAVDTYAVSNVCGISGIKVRDRLIKGQKGIRKFPLKYWVKSWKRRKVKSLDV